MSRPDGEAVWRTEVRSRLARVMLHRVRVAARPKMALVRDFAARVAHAQVSGSNGLLFTGSNGIGKTALLARTDSMLNQPGWRVAGIDRTRAEPSGRRCGMVWIRQACAGRPRDCTRGYRVFAVW
jgi:hypothetical protein